MLEIKKKKLELEKQKKREERKLLRQSMKAQNTNMFDVFRNNGFNQRNDTHEGASKDGYSKSQEDDESTFHS